MRISHTNRSALGRWRSNDLGELNKENEGTYLLTNSAREQFSRTFARNLLEKKPVLKYYRIKGLISFGI
jgi:hypothetical protein